MFNSSAVHASAEAPWSLKHLASAAERTGYNFVIDHSVLCNQKKKTVKNGERDIHQQTKAFE